MLARGCDMHADLEVQINSHSKVMKRTGTRTWLETLVLSSQTSS